MKILIMVEGGDGSGGLRDSDIKLVRPVLVFGILYALFE